MSRKDDQIDAMLRHLGAAYYDSLHGRAAPADVTRALNRVAEEMGESRGARRAEGARPLPDEAASRGRVQHGRWHSRVRDVMTTSVVTVDRITPYKEIARLLAEHRVSGLPVLTLGRHVAGVVTEADLMAARIPQPRGLAARLGLSRGRDPHHALTAGELMTSPAVTIHPDATIAAVARLMHSRQVRRLPVVDPAGKLLGIVSRRDLLSIFLRPDAEIARQVTELLAEVLPGEESGIKVSVHGGVVTLSGTPGPLAQRDLLPVAMRLVWDIDGVVDVIDHLTAAQPA